MNFSIADAIEMDVFDLTIEGVVFPVAIAPLKDFSLSPVNVLLTATDIEYDDLYGTIRSFRYDIIEILISLPSALDNRRIVEILFRCEQFGEDYSEYFLIGQEAFQVFVRLTETIKDDLVDWKKEGF